jgi:hypothetical protein
MTNQDQHRRRLIVLLDAASDAVMATSDADISAEVQIEQENPSERVALLQKMLADRIIVAKKQRLASARGKIDDAYQRSFTAIVTHTSAEMRTRINELMSRFVTPETRLTLAFRNGDDMSEADTASLLEDLELLANLQRGDS